jgi:hypothetical protein
VLGAVNVRELRTGRGNLWIKVVEEMSVLTRGAHQLRLEIKDGDLIQEVYIPYDPLV